MSRTLLLSLCTTLLSLPTYAYELNKDITNRGPPAFDVAIVLYGREEVTRTYPGYPVGSPNGGVFSFINTSTSRGDTVIHWQDFWDGTNNTIDTNQTIHVGYSTRDCNSRIKTAYWTDKNGRRIEGSAIYNLTPRWRNLLGRITVTFQHSFLGTGTIELRNVRYAITPQPYRLEALNASNQALMGSLRTLTAGFDLEPERSRDWVLPPTVPAGYFVTLVYEANSPMSTARSLDFIQFAPFMSGC